MRTWRGMKALLHDAVDATVELVREGHDSTSRAVRRVTDEVEPLREPVRAIDEVRRLSTSGVLGTIKLANRSIEALTDWGLSMGLPADEHGQPLPAVPLDSSITGSKEWVGDAVLGLVNAMVGDHLHRRGSELSLSMVLRAADRYVSVDSDSLREAIANPSGRVAVFVHGLGTTEWSWCLEAEAYHGDSTASFASMLARDEGITPLFVRYNTGRHVSENGRSLASLLEALVRAYPVPITDLTLFGHSMGGLVSSSACAHAEAEEMEWTRALRRVFYLGSPHQGAPLAKFGQALADTLGSVDLPATRILARILEGRSAGVHDLRHGALVDEEWLAPHPLARDSLPLAHAAHYFISASITQDAAHPLAQLVGDLLVRVPSAAGPKMKSETFSIDTRHYGGVMHHQLQNHPAVYEQIRQILARS